MPSQDIKVPAKHLEEEEIIELILILLELVMDPSEAKESVMN